MKKRTKYNKKLYTFYLQLQERSKSFNQSTESSQPTMPTVDQTDRAPIIVSPNNQPIDTENSNSSSGSSSSNTQKSKDPLCKAERSVIVRAGSSSACTAEPQNNVNKQVRFAKKLLCEKKLTRCKPIGSTTEVIARIKKLTLLKKLAYILL